MRAARPRRFSSTVRPSRRTARPAGKRGEATQAIGRSRGGRTTKIHALADCWCRPVRLMLTGGQVPDCIAAEPLLRCLPADALVVIGDKG